MSPQDRARKYYRMLYGSDAQHDSVWVGTVATAIAEAEVEVLGRSRRETVGGPTGPSGESTPPPLCPNCGSRGFGRSALGPDRCSFCDGSEGGNPPTLVEVVAAAIRTTPQRCVWCGAAPAPHGECPQTRLRPDVRFKGDAHLSADDYEAMAQAAIRPVLARAAFIAAHHVRPPGEGGMSRDDLDTRAQIAEALRGLA